MAIELKEPELVKQIEQLAAATTQPVEQVLEDAVEAYLEALERDALQAESRIFWDMQPQLAQAYPGEAIAMRGGKVVDHDPDIAALEARVRERFGALPVLIAPVSPPPPRELHWRDGRLEEAPRA